MIIKTIAMVMAMLTAITSDMEQGGKADPSEPITTGWKRVYLTQKNKIRVKYLNSCILQECT